MHSQSQEPLADRELVITRTIAATPDKLYRCWTEPDLIKEWFCPKPWSVSHAEVDVRPGGRSMIVMKSPDGHEFPNPGVYLEAIPGKKLVVTDAFVEGWEPAGEPFMVGIVTFEDNGDGTTLGTGPRTPQSVTRRWASSKAGPSAPISWRKLRARSDRQNRGGPDDV